MTIRNRLCCTTLCCMTVFFQGLDVFFQGHAGATEFDAQQLAKIPLRMQQFVVEGEISGAVTVVGSVNGIAQIAAVGDRDIESAQRMSHDTIFRIASMTKPITAIAIMQLVEQGKLSLDAPVEQYLPEFRGQMLVASRQEGSVSLRTPQRAITIRDLLTHTSGLPGGYPDGLGEMYRHRQRDLNESSLVMSQRPLEFEPGSRWSYCNAGIDILGRIIEVVSQRAFDRYLAESLFEPLGMRDTAIFPNAQQLARTALVYERRDDKLQVVADPLIGDPTGARHPIPAGGLFSTGPDLARLYQVLLSDGKFEGGQLLSVESLREMTRLQTGDLTCGFVEGMGFGLGFALVKQPMGVTSMLSAGTFGHGGAFGTQAWLDPRKKVFVILLIQRSGLPNADNSPLRRSFQELAFGAIQP